jgi:hypothetical protein
VPALNPDRIKWSEPPDENAMARPEGGSQWVGSFVAMAVFVALALSGLMILVSSLGNAWFWLWLLPAGLLISLGVYGVLRGVSGMLRPARPTEYSLTNLELRYEQNKGPLGEVWIRGQVRAQCEGKRPQSLTVVLELQPEQHPGKNAWLNSTYCKPDANGVYEFGLEVPRHQTVLGEVHGLLELNFNAQAAFSRVMLGPIAKTKPLELVSQPSRAQQLAAFEQDDSDELISRAYNGTSAGWLMHNVGPYLQDFSSSEKSRVFTISFAELVDHLEKINWFADKMINTLESPFDGNRILLDAGVYKVVYDQSDEQLRWLTTLHETKVEREAFEAFVLHSDPNSLALRGAKALLESRSTSTGSRPAQSY